MKIQLFHVIGEDEEELVSWTDSSPEKVEYFHINQNSMANYQFRNVKQADTATSTCINTVGSFHCVDTSDEMVAVGIGK